ncbi:hypothetical protein RRG08_056047, partial [Elysia crispata]
TSFSSEENLEFRIYFSNAESTMAAGESPCKGNHLYGAVFSVSTDKTNLEPVLEAVRSYSGQLGLSQISNQTFLFWVEDSDSLGCDALFLQHTAGWDFTVGYV